MAKKLTQRQLLSLCDRNVKKFKKTKGFNEKSYRRGFFNPKFNKQ